MILYFYKRISTATLFLFAMATMFTGIGYGRGVTSAYFIIGIGLYFLWIWQLFRTLFSDVKGTEVDNAARRFLQSSNLIRNAYHSLQVDEEDVEGAELLQMDGYCCIPLETEPLYRWDEEDQTARSSNYQRTCFFLDRDVAMLLTYTEVRSLVDKEFAESSHIWRFAGIRDILIENIPQRCRITPKKTTEKIAKEFTALTIIGENGERLSYAIGQEQMETAEYIRDAILGMKEKDPQLRKPVKDKEEKKVTIDYDTLDKSEKSTLQVGLIGDDLSDL